MKWIAIWGLVSLVCCLLAGPVAGYKNRDYSSWMAWTFVFPPLLLVLIVMPKFKGVRPRRPTLDEEERRSLSGH